MHFIRNIFAPRNNFTADITIIGAGFSGNLVLANLIRKLNSPKKIIIADDSKFPFRGLAYSTPRPEHLLNVRSSNMGAFADDAQNFYKWLSKGKYKQYSARDFVPRMIYGEYLQVINDEMSALAKQKGIDIKFIRSKAISVEADDDISIIKFEAGQEVETKMLVLATGNQVGDRSNKKQSQPWYFNFDSLKKAKTSKPLVIIGTGLTAVDTILSIFRSGYNGEVLCISRKGLFPRPHTSVEVHETEKKFDLTPHLKQIDTSRPSKIFHILKKLVDSEKGYTWQAIIDSMRPHTQQLWQGFSMHDQKRILHKYVPYWNIYRHRMAPEIDSEISSYVSNGRLKIIKGDCHGYKDNNVKFSIDDVEQSVNAAHIFDCRGLALDVLSGAFKGVEGKKLSANGYGLIGDANYMISGQGVPPVYAIGSCFAGHLFETVAVPELRVQAEKIASSIGSFIENK